MTLERIDQLVFGYEEGHRLLRGSSSVSGATLSTLLGATDAPVESTEQRVVTGLPLDSMGRYALCFTWKAPELPRPGAVWSHVLLVEPQHLDRSGSVAALRGLARRPKPWGLELYETQLSLGGEAIEDRAITVSRSLIEAVAAAVYGDGGSIVVHEDLAESEEALFAVWQAQWPGLRSRFAFRTRETARVATSSEVVVARRVRGLRRRAETLGHAAWIDALTVAIVEQEESPLHRFLATYGPSDKPEARTVGWLCRLFGNVESEDCNAVRDALEMRYGEPRVGCELKVQLFGKEQRLWWTVAEPARLNAVLGATCDAWDVERLELEGRLKDWIRANGVGRLLRGINNIGPARIRAALLNALRDGGRVADFAAVVRVQPELAAGWLVEAPEIGWRADAWRELGHQQVKGVWEILGAPGSAVLLAAAVAGHARAAVEVIGLAGALRIAAQAGNVSAATALVEAGGWTAALAAAEDGETTVLLGGISGGREVPKLMGALEARRHDVDEMWLRAAAATLAGTGPRVGKAMQIVFGPLHQAIVDGRLPSECWELLSRVLPYGSDPGLRFRRMLVLVAKEEGWGYKRCRRALRGAGAYAPELYRELSDDKLLLGRIRRAMKGL